MRECNWCKGPISTEKRASTRFCSKTCYFKHYHNNVTSNSPKKYQNKLCEECKVNKLTSRGKKFCSIKCSGRAKRAINTSKCLYTNDVAFNTSSRYLRQTTKACSICKLSTWQGQVIPLEVHHIDKDKTNNSLQNLSVLCINCHSQTLNWKSRVHGKYQVNNLSKNHKMYDAWRIKRYTRISEGTATAKIWRRVLHEETNDSCMICATVNWVGNPLSKELHHIDGDNTNNTRENLQWLCPNCHGQTHNYKSKNRAAIHKAVQEGS